MVLRLVAAAEAQAVRSSTIIGRVIIFSRFFIQNIIYSSVRFFFRVDLYSYGTAPTVSL